MNRAGWPLGWSWASRVCLPREPSPGGLALQGAPPVTPAESPRLDGAPAGAQELWPVTKTIPPEKATCFWGGPGRTRTSVSDGRPQDPRATSVASTAHLSPPLGLPHPECVCRQTLLLPHLLHAYAHTHTRTLAHTHTYTHVHTRTHVHTHTRAHMYTQAHTHTRAHMHTHVHTGTHAHTCTHAHTHVYTRAHAPTCAAAVHPPPCLWRWLSAPCRHPPSVPSSGPWELQCRPESQPPGLQGTPLERHFYLVFFSLEFLNRSDVFVSMYVVVKYSSSTNLSILWPTSSLLLYGSLPFPKFLWWRCLAFITVSKSLKISKYSHSGRLKNPDSSLSSRTTGDFFFSPSISKLSRVRYKSHWKYTKV